jgi:hypothetical protein
MTHIYFVYIDQILEGLVFYHSMSSTITYYSVKKFADLGLL